MKKYGALLCNKLKSTAQKRNTLFNYFLKLQNSCDHIKIAKTIVESMKIDFNAIFYIFFWSFFEVI